MISKALSAQAGRALVEPGDVAGRIAAFDAARCAFEAIPEDGLTDDIAEAYADVNVDLALTYSQRGDLRETRLAFERAIQLYGRLLQRGRPAGAKLANTERALASVLEECGELDGSRRQRLSARKRYLRLISDGRDDLKVSLAEVDVEIGWSLQQSADWHGATAAFGSAELSYSQLVEEGRREFIEPMAGATDLLALVPTRAAQEALQRPSNVSPVSDHVGDSSEVAVELLQQARYAYARLLRTQPWDDLTARLASADELLAAAYLRSGKTEEGRLAIVRARRAYAVLALLDSKNEYLEALCVSCWNELQFTPTENLSSDDYAVAREAPRDVAAVARRYTTSAWTPSSLYRSVFRSALQLALETKRLTDSESRDVAHAIDMLEGLSAEHEE